MNEINEWNENRKVNSIIEMFFKNVLPMYIAILIILVGTILRIFVGMPNFLKIILAVLVFASFIYLGAGLVYRDAKSIGRGKNLAPEEIVAHNKAYKAVDSVMTMAYGATTVLGAFCDSLLLMGVGLCLLILNTVGVFFTKKFFLKKYTRNIKRRG